MKYLPGLDAKSSIDARVGLRPYCIANKPLMGPAPRSPGLYVAAGHEGSGLTLAPASAGIMAAYILGIDQTQEGAAAFTPASIFGVR